MRIRYKVCCAAAVAAALLSAAPGAAAQGLGRRFDFNELTKMVDDAELLVRGRITSEPVTNGGGETGLAWRMTVEVAETLKGELDGQTLELHIKSPLDDLNCSRKRLIDKEYVLPLVAYAQAGAGHFRLVEDVGFAAETAEAGKLAEIAKGEVKSETVIPLRLRLEPIRPPYEVGKPALLRVAIENPSPEVISYTQAPLDVRDGELYIIGDGNLIVADISDVGGTVPARQTLHVGVAPPEPPVPAVIRPAGKFTTELDLAGYFDLARPSVYMVTMVLAGPNGKEVMRSNTVSVQIIAPLTAPVDPVEPTSPTAADALLIPSPEAYRPGEPENGLAALLKPIKPEFEVGEPIALELRFINLSDRSTDVDTRLERTLIFDVQGQGDSPPVRPLLQRPDETARPGDYVYAHLRPLAFWGKVINVNSLYGRDTASLLMSGKAAADGVVEPVYETHGMTLFSFDKPGVYKIRGTYQVKPVGSEGPRIWTGKLTSNPVFVRVTPKTGGDDEPPVSLE